MIFENLQQMMDSMRELERSTFHPYDDPDLFLIGYREEYSGLEFMIEVSNLANSLESIENQERKSILKQAFSSKDCRLEFAKALSRDKNMADKADIFMFRNYVKEK